MSEVPSAGRPSRRLVRAAIMVLLLPAAGLAALWLTLPDPDRWASEPPRSTALVEQRRSEARAAGREYHPAMRWVALDRISRRLVDAVVAAEDASFFQHHGFDWEALWGAFRHNLTHGQYARGASTITQQLAKNLALCTEKSLLRKSREALLTVKLERRLDKRRLLALYLNVAEWGDGIFGAETAAQRHFGSSAASLTTAQAVLLAAMLPAPRRATLSPAPPWLAARARGLLQRLRDEQVIPAAEAATARAELETYLGGLPVATPGQEDAEPPADDAPADDAPGVGTGPVPAGEAAPAPEPAAEPAEPPAVSGDPPAATTAPAASEGSDQSRPAGAGPAAEPPLNRASP